MRFSSAAPKAHLTARQDRCPTRFRRERSRDGGLGKYKVLASTSNLSILISDRPKSLTKCRELHIHTLYYTVHSIPVHLTSIWQQACDLISTSSLIFLLRTSAISLFTMSTTMSPEAALLKQWFPWTSTPLIVGAPMRTVSGPKLTAAIHEAEGLGMHPSHLPSLSSSPAPNSHSQVSSASATSSPTSPPSSKLRKTSSPAPRGCLLLPQPASASAS